MDHHDLEFQRHLSAAGWTTPQEPIGSHERDALWQRWRSPDNEVLQVEWTPEAARRADFDACMTKEVRAALDSESSKLVVCSREVRHSGHRGLEAFHRECLDVVPPAKWRVEVDDLTAGDNFVERGVVLSVGRVGLHAADRSLNITGPALGGPYAWCRSLSGGVRVEGVMFEPEDRIEHHAVWTVEPE